MNLANFAPKRFRATNGALLMKVGLLCSTRIHIRNGNFFGTFKFAHATFLLSVEYSKDSKMTIYPDYLRFDPEDPDKKLTTLAAIYEDHPHQISAFYLQRFGSGRQNTMQNH